MKSKLTARLRSTTYARLLARDDFRLLWLAQVVSTVGTYTYTLAVASVLTQRDSGASLAHTVALVLGVQASAAAGTGLLLAGPVADRFNRRRTMILSDVVRFLAVATLFAGMPSTLHLAVVAAVLGSFGALFDPCLTASLPNVVEEEELVPANAVIGSTFYGSAMIGPGLGAALVAVLGAQIAFGLNALSFVASAVLLAGANFRHTTEASGRLTPVALARDLRDGARHVFSSPIASGILVTMGIAMVAWGAQAPAQIVFVKQVLAPGPGAGSTRAFAFATLTTSWAAGMLVGSLVSPLIIRRIPRERLIPLGLLMIGTSVMMAADRGSVVGVAALWFVAGAMCGVMNVCYESLLQERTPDGFRGRVIATIEAAQEATYLLGVAVAAFLSSRFASPDVLRFAGIISLLAAAGAIRLIPRSLAPEGATDAAPEARSEFHTPPAAPDPDFGYSHRGLPPPWAVSRNGSVAHLHLRWPLVSRDWDSIIAELSDAIDGGTRAVILPTRLHPGSRVPRRRLDELWAALIDMSITVERSEAESPTASDPSPSLLGAGERLGGPVHDVRRRRDDHELA